MGYEISIQREDEDNKITTEEWVDYIHSDSEFTLEYEDSSQTSEPNAIWNTSKGKVFFTFSEEEGWISVKNPDDWIIWKMVDIADSLDAVALGEEGEKYDESYEVYHNESDDFESIPDRKPWWRFW